MIEMIVWLRVIKRLLGGTECHITPPPLLEMIPANNHHFGRPNDPPINHLNSRL